MILITTSRRPTQKMRLLCKNLNRVLPDTVRINRGKLSINGVMEKAIEYGADRVIIIERYKGGPGRILFLKIILEKFIQAPFQIYLVGIKTQEDMKTKTIIKENLIITTPRNSDTQIKGFASFLSNFLRIPYFEDLGNLKFQASIHLTIITKYEIKISFTMPPTVKDVGPILIVKQTPSQDIEK